MPVKYYPWIIAALVVLSSTVALAKTPAWHSVLAFPRDEIISAPAGLTIDQSRKRYYLVDYRGSQLVSFDEKGQLIDRFDAAGVLQQPVALAFGAGGKLWVTQRSSNELLYIDLQSRDIRRFNLDKTTGNAIFIDKIATDDRNRLYVMNSASGRVIRLDDNLRIDAVFSAKADSQLVDFKIKGQTLYALDGRHNQLLRYDLNGKQLAAVALKGDLANAVSFDLDAAGAIYVVDRANARIAVFSPVGTFSYDFGRRGARRGQFNYPADLSFDWNGNLCVVNQGNDRVEIFKQ